MQSAMITSSLVEQPTTWPNFARGLFLTTRAFWANFPRWAGSRPPAPLSPLLGPRPRLGGKCITYFSIQNHLQAYAIRTLFLLR